VCSHVTMENPDITTEAYIQMETKKLLGAIRCLNGKWLYMVRSGTHLGVIAFSIAGRSQAPEKGLIVVVRDVTIIDMDELVRLHTCERLGDVKTCVAARQEKQQAPSANAPAPRDTAKRLQRLKDKVHGFGISLAEQRVVLDVMSSDLTMLSTWLVSRMTQLMDWRGLRYDRFDRSIIGTSHIDYERRREPSGRLNEIGNPYFLEFICVVVMLTKDFIDAVKDYYWCWSSWKRLSVNTAFEVTTAGTQVNTTNIDNLSDAVIHAFLASQPRRNLNLNGNETVSFDKTKVECYNCHKRGHFARECRAPRAEDNRSRESTRRNVLVETTNSIALVSCDGLGGYDWSDQVEEGPNYALMAYSTSSSNFEHVVETSEANACEDKPKVVGNNYGPPIIEDWKSDDVDESVPQPNIEKKTVKPIFAKIEFVKSK
nr:hypothetical protein [Tanacetum cinerariifolium]